jgi:hypothetical protein
MELVIASIVGITQRPMAGATPASATLSSGNP